jgi:hypothetical protein
MSIFNHVKGFLHQQKQKFTEEFVRWDGVKNDKEKENESETKKRQDRIGEKTDRIDKYGDE